MLRLSTLLLLLLSPLALRAQLTPTQPRRLELPLDPGTSDVRVLPLADTTVAVFVESTAGSSFRPEYSFQHFDRDLRPLRNLPVKVDREYRLVQATAAAPYAFALFESEYVASKFQVFRLDLRTGEVEGFLFDTKTVEDLYDLEVLDGKLFATVQVQRHLTVLHIDVDQEEFRLLPAVYESIPTEVTFLPDSATQRAGYVVSQSNGFLSRLQIKQLSAQGQLLASRFIQAESGRGLITAQLSPGDSTQRLVAGTYTLRDPRYSQGLFASNLPGDPALRPPLRFYDFAVLKHFFDFMKPRRAARLRARSAELRAAGRELRLRYRILTHRMIPFRDGYVLVGEVYYPQYRTGNSYYGWSGMAPRYYDSYRSNLTQRNLDGYRSTHAVVCGFDRYGTLLWDNTFVLKNVEQNTLTETVRLRPLADGQRLVLAYLDKDKLRYKIVDGTTTSPNDLEAPIQTNAEGKHEKTLDTEQQGVLPWYGSRFLTYGYQRVRPEHGSARQVFFLNVVAFD
ncbi:hypothetical protein [Hymenobacter jeollabukensis]|uniref:Uncharacterized protein n=1 Tax=Hymenobacter jeollabukensis TaxID=2025313 RepID=A0A5R8WPT3_9BACT|nr:hypothetical protein [Hymenobacter jeollabukensis]TLM92323.1 hypothetical protein FDY95_12885 [Hymenobacter jeollabukensis]